MIKYLKKVFIFFIVYTTIIYITSILYPIKEQSNGRFEYKLNSISERVDSLNVFFFGSSRVYRQIDPRIFDEYSNYKTKSFNLGMAGMFNPECGQMVKYFAERYPNLSNDEKFIFFEHQNFNGIETKNLKSLSYTGISNFKNIRLILKSFGFNKLNKWREYIVNPLKSLFSAKLGSVWLRASLKNIFYEQQPRFDLLYEVNEQKNGYRGYSEILKSRDPNIQKYININKKYKAKVKKHPWLINRHLKFIKSNTAIQNNYVQEFYDNYYEDLRQYLDKFGYKLILFCTPNVRNEKVYSYQMNEIPLLKNYILDKAFYQSELYFNENHFNRKGAIYLSKSIGLEFNYHMKKNH